MKKHDEGYVLAFVMVVILVLCIVAVSMMTASARNLQAQENAIQRMQEKYAAQGEIEKVVSVIESGVTISDPDKKGLQEALKTFLSGCITVNQIDGISDELNPFVATLQITSNPGNAYVKIDATIEWKANVVLEGNIYTITDSQVTYESYQISSIETGEEAGE